MSTKLVQKHFFKGIRNFEIVDDVVNVRIKTFNKKEESQTVMLSVLNPDPVISKSTLDFTSRVNNEPLLSLFLAKPNAEEFNAFVNLLKQKAQDEFHSFAGLRAGTRSGRDGNVDEGAPEFNTPDSPYAIASRKQVDPGRIEEAVHMLSTHVGRETIEPFVALLEELQADPQNDALLARMVDEFSGLGPAQGAVLTYAPYISSLLSDDPFTKS